MSKKPRIKRARAKKLARSQRCKITEVRPAQLKPKRRPCYSYYRGTY